MEQLYLFFALLVIIDELQFEEQDVEHFHVGELVSTLFIKIQELFLRLKVCLSE